MNVRGQRTRNLDFGNWNNFNSLPIHGLAGERGEHWEQGIFGNKGTRGSWEQWILEIGIILIACPFMGWLGNGEVGIAD
jgi:hypothetical protein